jgi:hypothetical protein
MKLRNQTKLKFKAILVTMLISGMIGGIYAGLIQSFESIELLQGVFIGVGISLRKN